MPVKPLGPEGRHAKKNAGTDGQMTRYGGLLAPKESEMKAKR